MERLDKVLARELNITRSQAKAFVKTHEVLLNGVRRTSGEVKCGETDSLTVDGSALGQAPFVYIMLNKPAGVVCATEDEGTTVLDLLPDALRRKNLFPAGRLDKDTTGFVLITDDGAFAHDILSPKKHIEKTYLATLDKPITAAVIADFEKGMQLGGETLLPAQLCENGDACHVRVVLRQGIYHQIKRMFQKHGMTVLALRRVAMGALPLDETLAEGECRLLTKDELCQIKSKS